MRNEDAQISEHTNFWMKCLERHPTLRETLGCADELCLYYLHSFTVTQLDSPIRHRLRAQVSVSWKPHFRKYRNRKNYIGTSLLYSNKNVDANHMEDGQSRIPTVPKTHRRFPWSKRWFNNREQKNGFLGMVSGRHQKTQQFGLQEPSFRRFGQILTSTIIRLAQ